MNTHLKSFLNECSVGVLSTCDKNEIHSVPVYYFYHEEQNSFYFITKSKTSKTSNLEKNNRANFSIYSERLPRVYTARCSADILDIDASNYSDIIKKLAEVHSTREYYPSPLSSMKKGDLILVKLKVIDFKFNVYAEPLSEQKTA
jgi:uncharacterized protein YhbP (UPF0306 family)